MTEPAPDRRSGALVDWLREQDLLRGPHLFVDYWASVLGLKSMIPERHVRAGLVDPPLFRAGLDRPDLQLPRVRFYLLLLLSGPLLLAFRSYRRLGRYRIRTASRFGREVHAALQRYRLETERASPGRVHVSKDGVTLARDVLDPNLVSGFCSLFWAAYKLPVATFSAILLVGILAPAMYAVGRLDLMAAYWATIGYPLAVGLLYLLYREWVTALLGALPLLIGPYLVRFVQPATVEGWLPFFWPLAALFLLYLLIDWFFFPRPVPPALLFYTAEGAGRAYDRPGDSPYWLEGEAYWVWRYLVLSPAELNKFWERDWERVELWIRADGDRAGMLEWVVTDLHYRELWLPFDELGPKKAMQRHCDDAREALAACEPGVWVIEVDADLLVHYPFIRNITFLAESDGVPVRGALDLLGSLWRRVRVEPSDDDLAALERVRLRIGRPLLADVPEFVVRRVSRHLMSQPWRYWRYPLGAATRAEPRVYARAEGSEPALASDPDLQIRA